MNSHLICRIHAWVIWFLSASFMFYKFALEVSPSIMVAPLMKTFAINGAAMGNLAACYFYAYLVMQIPAGLLVDRFGPRRVTTIAIICCSGGSILFSFSEHLYFACIGRLITGTGAAFAVVNCLKLISNWFPMRRFAFMAGLMMTIGMLGAVGGQAPLALFIDSYPWQQAMRFIGYAGLGLAILFWLAVRDLSPEHKHSKSLTSSRVSLLSGLKTLCKKPQTWWLSIYSGFSFAPILVFGGLWGVSFVQEVFGTTHNASAQAVSLIFIGVAIGAPFMGFVSDWLGKRRIVLFWGTLIALLSLSFVIFSPVYSNSLLIVSLFIFGFSISCFLLSFSMIKESNSIAIAATAMGFMNAMESFFGAFSDPLTGLFLDLGWDGRLIDGVRRYAVGDYQLAFLTIPAFLIIALISLPFIKETLCKHSTPSALP